MMPIPVARQLATQRQREFEHRAAQHRLVRHLRACRRGRIEHLAGAARRLAVALVPRRRQVAGAPALANTSTCCCPA